MNEQVAKTFTDVLFRGKKFRVKLLGDSITHGLGGTGFEQNGEPIAEGFHRNPNGYCWAKQFKEYLEAHFPCEVINNACTGTDIQFILRNFDTLVSPDDDFILCAIGTNNRHQRFETGERRTPEEHGKILYDNIGILHQKIKDLGIPVVFVANTPAAASSEQDGPDFWRILHMPDIVEIYKRAAAAFNFPLISMYDLFLEYCESNGIEFETLLKDGLHPTDAGYDVIFQLYLKEFGI